MAPLVSIPCKRYRVIQRSRSQHFYLARDSLREVVDGGIDGLTGGPARENLDLEIVERHYDNWRARYHSSYIHLEGREKHLFLKAVCRFDPSYRAVLKKRMLAMTFVKWAVKLEITLDPKGFYSLYDEFKFLPKLWNVVRVWLERNYGKFEFLRILETTKKGRPHLHILVVFHDEKVNSWFRAMRRKDKESRFQSFYGEFKSEVLKNKGGWVWVRPVKGKLNLVSYAMKYVNKSINVENKRYSALLFASNTRIFGLSRGLAVYDNRPKRPKAGYEYQGCVPSGELKVFCEENKIPFGLSVSVDPGLEDPYSYPLLFLQKGG